MDGQDIQDFAIGDDILTEDGELGDEGAAGGDEGAGLADETEEDEAEEETVGTE